MDNENNIFRKLRSRYDTDAKEFTAKELSNKIGLIPKVISILENKEKNGHEPTLTELKVYHKEFNDVPYEYLLGESSSNSYENQTLAKNLGLSDPEIQKIEEIQDGYKSNNDTDIMKRNALELLLQNEHLLELIGSYISVDYEVQSGEACVPEDEYTDNYFKSKIRVTDKKTNKVHCYDVKNIPNMLLIGIQEELMTLRAMKSE